MVVRKRLVNRIVMRRWLNQDAEKESQQPARKVSNEHRYLALLKIPDLKSSGVDIIFLHKRIQLSSSELEFEIAGWC